MVLEVDLVLPCGYKGDSLQALKLVHLSRLRWFPLNVLWLEFTTRPTSATVELQPHKQPLQYVHQ